TLKTTLEQYDQAEQSEESSGPGCARDDSTIADVEAAGTASAEPRADRKELAARIASLKNDATKPLRDGVETVSKYSGRALPETARVLVRRHLTSLPRKWQLAMVTSNSSRPQSSSSDAQMTGIEQGDKGHEKNVKEGAQRVLILAKEGLEMMTQVSG